ncbi:MAG: hypothetical protein ACRC6X_02830 [Culicoidibacterales bacterium]
MNGKNISVRSALFFTGMPYSHVLPLKPLIDMLKKDNYTIFILGVKENRFLIKSMKAIFIEYPFDPV